MCKAWQLIFSCFSLCALVKRCFGLWRNENGMNGYTYGMDVFGKDEMEVLGTDAKPSDLRDFLASLVSYVLENDVDRKSVV